MVAIVYARVSSEDQARNGFSLASQVEQGAGRAAELGASEIRTFADEGVPGDVLERPGLQQALEALQQGGVTHFVCFDPDRLARSLSLQLVVTDQIERAGARLEFVNFDYRNTPEGQLFYALRGAISQYEKAKIRERTMRGKRQKARGGGLTHNPNLYGYTFDPTSDSLSMNHREADIVRLIFRWFLDEDMGPSAIAARLTSLGISPPRGGRAWHHSTVRAMLANQSYTGAYHQQKWDAAETRTNKYRAPGQKVRRRIKPRAEWLPVAIPPIVEEAVWQAAAKRLRGARRRWSGFRREVYLLGGLAVCGLCGRPVHGASRASGRGRIRYYVCRGYAPGVPGQPRCPFGRVRAEDLEAAVRAALGRLVRPHLGPAPAPHDDARLLEEQLKGLQAEHERTARLLVRGALDPATGERLLAEQRDRMAHIQREMATARPETIPIVPPHLDSMPPAAWQHLTRAVVCRATVHPESVHLVSPLAGADARPLLPQTPFQPE